MSDHANEAGRAKLQSVQNWIGRMRPSLTEIASINAQIKMLGLNARLEARRAGNAGRAFGVVAEELGKLSHRTAACAGQLTQDIDGFLRQMQDAEIVSTGQRLSDLALNTIELMDRNLYERSCDVRWWATDAALWTACANTRDALKARLASERLATILRSYTVYSDLILLDLSGRVLAGAGDTANHLIGKVTHKATWFSAASRLESGEEFAVQDVEYDSIFETVAPIYSAAIREGGTERGHVIGVLAIVFDWSTQTQRVMRGLRLDPSEHERTRCVVFNKAGVVITSSDGMGVLTESLEHLEGVRRAMGGEKGFCVETGGALTAYAHTPGYETYRGLGWSCAFLRKP